MTTLSANKLLRLRRHLTRTRVWWGAGIVGALILVGIAIATIASAAVGQHIVRSTTVQGVNVGGMDTLTATHLLEQRWELFNKSAFQFSGAGRTMSILVAHDASTEEEIMLSTVDFDPTEAVQRALAFGRRGSWWQQVRERTSGWIGRRHELGTLKVDELSLRETLLGKFGDLDTAAINPKLSVEADGSASIVPGVSGAAFDYPRAARVAAAEARQLDTTPIILQRFVTAPAIAESNALAMIAERDVTPLLHRAPLTLTYQEKHWTISAEQLRTMLGFAGTTAAPTIGFDLTATTAWLKPVITAVQVNPQNAKFSVVDGRVQEFQTSAVGVTLDVAGTIAAMQRDLITNRSASANAVVIEEKPLTDTVATNDLGITEVVAQAQTNFKGSPTNRKFNLGYGAKLLNGLLIQPGEEFSLVKALGKIDGAHGWKPELVIKGSDITPEFGGGLCQVATTLFRTALNAGLPIVERHNHSLRISYYEPPVGLDATIYEPKPDLRFTNDYSTPLLLQTSVDGTILSFTFYGTKDGRTVDIPEPRVYNKVPIPAQKNIEVDDLKPGEQECQKPGHPGADATATYTVTKADGATVTQTFQSHYRAIGVICRVGKKAVTKPAPTPVPEPVVNTNTAQ